MAFDFKKMFARKTGGNYGDQSNGNYSSNWLDVGPTFGGGRSGSKQEDTAMMVSAYYRGAIYISSQIAKIPWKVKSDKNEVVAGTLTTMLNLSPSEEMNSMSYRLVMTQCAIHHGNGYAEIERDVLGRPTAMYWLPNCDVEIWRLNTDELAYKISGNSAPDGIFYLRAKDVFHVRNPHTRDGLGGLGLLAYAASSLHISSAADDMAGDLFRNAGLPSGFISITGKLSKEASDRLKDGWGTQNGRRKSGGTAVLENDAKFTALNMDPQLLQFLESRKFGVLELARFFGLPPTKLYDTTGATFSNVENANLEVLNDTITTWACIWEMEADVKLLNNQHSGRYSEMDLRELTRADIKSRSTYYKDMMSVGAITPNEIRDDEGMAPYKDGDKYFIATNNYTPSDRLDEVIDSQIKSKNTPANPQTVPAVEKPKPKSELEEAALVYLTKNI